MNIPFHNVLDLLNKLSNCDPKILKLMNDWHENNMQNSIIEISYATKTIEFPDMVIHYYNKDNCRRKIELTTSDFDEYNIKFDLYYGNGGFVIKALSIAGLQIPQKTS